MRGDSTAVKRGGLALAAAFALSFCGDAWAQDASDAQREACTPDAFRLCSAEIPDAARVAACMQANVNSLSPPCRAYFHPANAAPQPAPRRRIYRHYYTHAHPKPDEHHYEWDSDD